MTLPLVSCIMPTRNRPALALRAILCFQEQTYAPRELVVIYNGPEATPPVWLMEATGAASAAGNIFLDCEAPGQSIQTYRRIGSEAARGEWVAVWDDDDWYHPERLAAELAAARAHPGAQLVGLAPWETVATPDGRVFLGDCGARGNRVWDHSMVARRDVFLASMQLPERPREDGLMRFMMSVPRGAWAVIDRPDLYLCNYHGDNASLVDYGWARSFAPSRCRPLPGVTPDAIMFGHYTADELRALAGVPA